MSFPPFIPFSKAIMRSFSLLQESIVPYIPTLIGQLTHKLLQVSKVTHSSLALIDGGRFAEIFVWQRQRSAVGKMFLPAFRIPASLTLTTTCLSPCVCRSASPARQTPLLSAVLRKHFSPFSRRSFRTMFRVCQLCGKWTFPSVDYDSNSAGARWDDSTPLFVFFCRVSSICVPGDVSPSRNPLQFYSRFLYGFIPSPVATCTMGTNREHPSSGAPPSGLLGEGRCNYC